MGLYRQKSYNIFYICTKYIFLTIPNSSRRRLRNSRSSNTSILLVGIYAFLNFSQINHFYMHLANNVSLQDKHTFGLPIKAAYYSLIRNEKELKQLLAMPVIQQNPIFILGHGSNVLFLQDFKGCVLQLATNGITTIKKTNHAVWLRVGAGLNWHNLVEYCVENGYGGVENLSLIPSTVGAAPIQNIGAYGVEFSEVLDSVEALEIATGAIQHFDKSACQLSYRNSIFKQQLKGKYVILYVTIQLSLKPIFKIDYEPIAKSLADQGISRPTLQAISQTIVAIRKSKISNPAKLGNAGSFFKNPLISQVTFDALKQHNPDLKGHMVDDGKIKIPAAWLIEACGWKGYRIGNVGVSEQHALILVHYGGGTANEVWTLAQRIQYSVQERFGITLEPEVEIIS